MKIMTRTERVGEWLGDIDWSYDFDSRGWDKKGSLNPKYIREHIKNLKIIEDALRNKKKVFGTFYGIDHEILGCGMFDGWPHWEPTPCVRIKTWSGSENMFWYQLGSPPEVK